MVKQEGVDVAVKIPGRRSSSDERVQEILRDPKNYFEKARKAARAEVTAERQQQQAALRQRPV